MTFAPSECPGGAWEGGRSPSTRAAVYLHAPPPTRLLDTGCPLGVVPRLPGRVAAGGRAPSLEADVSCMYYPPCPNRYGLMGSRDAVKCDRMPGHKGPHSNHAAGLRWANFGARPGRCPWAACTAPDDQDAEGTHACPGGEGARLLEAWNSPRPKVAP